MALGAAPVGQRFENPRELLGDRLKGVYRLLAEHGDRLFPHDYFADLYKDSARGRPTIPARVLRDRVRVLDSTPIYDAVSTQDTVTQLRSAIRKLLRVLEGTVLAGRVRAVLVRDDDYASAGKPPCDWDDPQERELLVDGLVRDALAALGVIDGEMLVGAARRSSRVVGGGRRTGRRSGR